jgi:thiol-disulfide isomerase/thioredoxin
MKKLLFLFLLVFAVSCSHECDEFEIEGKVTLEGGNGNVPIEVRLYEYGYRQFDSTLLAKAEMEPNGEFEINVPEGSRFKLHIAAPGYKNLITDFERLDIEEDEIECEVFLRKLRIPPFDKVKVIGDFNEWVWAEGTMMTQQEDGSWAVEVEYPENEMMYQLIIGEVGQSIAFFSEGGKFEYDNGGDFREVLTSDNGKYKITLKEGDFARRDTIERPNSSLDFTEPQKYADYQFILDKLDQNEMQQLQMNYQFLVLRLNDDYIAHLTPEQIVKGAKNSEESFERKNIIIDSLLEVTTDQEMRDYLLCSKYNLLIITDDKKFEDALEIFDGIHGIPAPFGTTVPTFLYWDEVKAEPHKYLGKFQKIIDNTKDLNTRAWNQLYLYNTMNDIDTTGGYEKACLKGLVDLKTWKGLDEQFYTTIDKEIASINLSKTDLAPDFDFVDFEGNKHKLSEFRGKWVFLDFWAVWCSPCRMEIPHIAKAYNAFKGENIQFLSVSHDGTIETPKKYNEENGMEWMQTINLPDYCNASTLYGVSGIPAPFLIDPDGKLIKISAGKLRGDDLMKTLNKYVLGK